MSEDELAPQPVAPSSRPAADGPPPLVAPPPKPVDPNAPVLSTAEAEVKLVKSEIKAAASEALNAPWGELKPTEELTADEKLWGMLANLLGLFWILGPALALILKGSSKFVKFNAIQMLCWHVVGIAIGFVCMIVSIVLVSIPFIGPLLTGLLFSLLSAASLAVVVLVAIKANSGVIYRLPLIGQFAYKNAYTE